MYVLYALVCPYAIAMWSQIAKFMGWTWGTPGGRLNKKDGLTRYGDSHVKDKTS